MVPTNLKNDRAESLILDIRAGRNAAIQNVDRPGAFLIFPTSVVIGGRAGAQLVFPLGSDAEPGVVVTSPGTARVCGIVAGVTVTGVFHWDFGAVTVPEACYHFRKRGRDVPAPAWAGQLPRSQGLASVGRVGLARQQVRLQRRGRDAERLLLTLTEHVIRRSCRGPIRRALRYRPVVDVDDVVQRSLQTACRLLPLYASKDRPPCSWLGMVRLDGRRDLHREVSRLDWLPADAVTALTLAKACGVNRQPDPSSTLAVLVAAAERIGRSVPRIAATQLDAALRGPALLAQESEAAATVLGPDSLDRDRGRVAATVARLVTEDADVIALAAAGDPRALRRVGDQVVRRLSDGRESPPVARRRCWEQFQRSGELFASAVGLERFGAVADPVSLAAIDECLRSAAGIRLSSDVG